MFRSSYLRKYRIFSIFMSLIFILGLVASSPVTYAAQYTATKSVEIESPDYSEHTPGSWHIDKSAEWTGKGRAKVTFDVDASIPQVEDEDKRHKDVLLVLDTSGSMLGDKLTALMQQARQLIDDLLADPENRIAIIYFNGGGTSVYDCSDILTDGFINDSVALQSAISSLVAGGRGTDYHAAFTRALECLEGYTQRDKTDLNVLFLTDGRPNINCYLQVGDFKELKEKYPYALVHGIQYEMGDVIYPDVKSVSDVGWFSDRTNLYEILGNAAYSSLACSVFCEKFEIVDYINNDLFRVNSVDDITVSYGSVELQEENGQQKIIWTVNDFYSYCKPKMEINITLKEGKEGGYDNFFPTNTKEDVTYKFPEQSENSITSEKTPVLQNYKVHYNANRPNEKASNYDDAHTNSEENHQAFETVEKSWPDGENCDGYLFKGWKYADGTPDETRIYIWKKFIMPSADVYLNGTWGKFSVKKSMKGQIATTVTAAMLDTGEKVNLAMKELAGNSNVSSVYNNDYKKIKRIDYEEISGLDGGENDAATIRTARGLSEDTEIRVVSIGQLDNELFEGKIYMWCEIDPEPSIFIEKDKIIYWTSNMETVMLNPNCSYMFACFPYLKDINDFDKFNANRVTNVQNMFRYATELTSVDLSNFETGKLVNNGLNLMFYGCSKIETIDLSKVDASEIKNMSETFKDCSKLKNLVLGGKFAPTNLINGYCTFLNCSSVETIDLSNIKGAASGNGMFKDCTNLKTIIAGNDLTFTTGSQMFTNCTNLKGGAGTTWDSGHQDYQYARIDAPDNDRPGYFTSLAQYQAQQQQQP